MNEQVQSVFKGSDLRIKGLNMNPEKYYRITVKVIDEVYDDLPLRPEKDFCSKFINDEQKREKEDNPRDSTFCKKGEVGEALNKILEEEDD